MILGLFGLAGCDKDDTGTQPGQPGTVKGSVMLYYAAKEVYLVSGTDTLKTSVTPSNIYYERFGTFEFNQVPPGDYKLGVNPILNFWPPDPVFIRVSSGQTVETPRFKVYSSDHAHGIFSLTYNDTVYTGNASVAGKQIIMSTPRYYFSVTLPVIKGPGTYSTTTHTGIQARFNAYNYQDWYANNTMGSVIVNVTAFDSVSRLGHGTFSFTALKPGKPDVVVTKGVLNPVHMDL